MHFTAKFPPSISIRARAVHPMEENVVCNTTNLASNARLVLCVKDSQARFAYLTELYEYHV